MRLEGQFDVDYVQKYFTAISLGGDVELQRYMKGIDDVNRAASNIPDHNIVNKFSNYKCVDVPKHGAIIGLGIPGFPQYNIALANGAQIPIG